MLSLYPRSLSRSTCQTGSRKILPKLGLTRYSKLAVVIFAMKDLLGLVFLRLIVDERLHVGRDTGADLNQAEISLRLKNHVAKSVALADLFLHVHDRFGVRERDAGWCVLTNRTRDVLVQYDVVVVFDLRLDR